MAVRTTSGTDHRRALPTYARAAAMIEINPTGIGRAVKKLGITPVEWGGKEKRLEVVDLLRIAQQARRATVDEVAGMLMEQVERDHPELADAMSAEIDRYYADVHPAAPGPNGFLDEIRATLPTEHAETVARIYRRYTTSS